jgi:hypothetical protein
VDRASKLVPGGGWNAITRMVAAYHPSPKPYGPRSTCDCGAHQQLVDLLDARAGSLHPRDERSSHLEFRLAGVGRAWRQSSLPLRGEQARVAGAIPRADFTYKQSAQPRSPEGFENVRGVLVFCLMPLWSLHLHFTLALLLLSARSPGPPFPPGPPSGRGTGGYYPLITTPTYPPRG